MTTKFCSPPLQQNHEVAKIPMYKLNFFKPK